MSEPFTFDGLAEKIVREYLPDALQAGADVIERELRARTPERVDIGVSLRPKLKNAISTDIEIDQDYSGGTAQVGFGDQGYIARFVEFGHSQVTHDKRPVGHTPAHPFIRPAATAAADGAIEAVADSLAESINARK